MRSGGLHVVPGWAALASKRTRWHSCCKSPLIAAPQEHTPSRLGEAYLPCRYAIAPCVNHQQCAWATGQPYLVSAVAPLAVNHP